MEKKAQKIQLPAAQSTPLKIMMHIATRLFHQSRHLLTQFARVLPSSCALCGRIHQTTICDACHAQFFSLRKSRCTQCAIPLIRSLNENIHFVSRCGNCLRQSLAFDNSIVATDYAPPIDQLVLALKFGRRLALAPLFADMLRDAMLSDRQQTPQTLPTLLIAVPLGPQRLTERGFNQALEIAKPLACTLGIPLVADLARRSHDTQAQATLHPDARYKNMQNAFTLSHHAIHLVKEQHIGIVDDVMTTGATLNALATVLKRFGAKRVTNIVFARTSLQ